MLTFFGLMIVALVFGILMQDTNKSLSRIADALEKQNEAKDKNSEKEKENG